MIDLNGILTRALKFLGSSTTSGLFSKKRSHTAIGRDDDDDSDSEDDIATVNEPPYKRSRFYESTSDNQVISNDFSRTKIRRRLSNFPYFPHLNTLSSPFEMGSDENRYERKSWMHSNVPASTSKWVYAEGAYSQADGPKKIANKENFSLTFSSPRQGKNSDPEIQYVDSSSSKVPTDIPRSDLYPCPSSTFDSFRFMPQVTSTVNRETASVCKRKPIKSARFHIPESEKIFSLRKPGRSFKVKDESNKFTNLLRHGALSKPRHPSFWSRYNTSMQCVRLEDKRLYKELLQNFTSSNVGQSGFKLPSMNIFSSGVNYSENEKKAVSTGALSKTQLDENYVSEKRKLLEEAEKNGTKFPITTTASQNHKSLSLNWASNTPKRSAAEIPVIDLEADAATKGSYDDDIIITKEIIAPRQERNSLENKFLASEYYNGDFLQKFKDEHYEKNKNYLEDLEKAKREQKESEKHRQDVYHEKLDNSLIKRIALLNLKYPQRFIEISEEEEEKLPELTPEIEKRIEIAFKGGPASHVLAEKFSIQITRKDIHTLAGLNWLNDEIINFYMNMIVERSQKGNNRFPRVYAFNTFFYGKLIKTGYSSVKRWTKKVDIFENDLLLVPVHLGMHWCLATVDFRSKSICYYDSMLGDNYKCLQELKNYLNSEHEDKKKAPYDVSLLNIENIKDIPQQMNGSDCGMFSCKFAEYLSRDAQITFSQEHMPYFRRRMVYEIVTQKLMYP